MPLEEAYGLLPTSECRQNFYSLEGFTGEIFLPVMHVENQVPEKEVIKPFNKRCSSYKSIFLSFVHVMHLS